MYMQLDIIDKERNETKSNASSQYVKRKLTEGLLASRNTLFIKT